MASMDEQVLRAAKEIVAELFENGRVSPAVLAKRLKIFTTLWKKP